MYFMDNLLLEPHGNFFLIIDIHITICKNIFPKMGLLKQSYIFEIKASNETYRLIKYKSGALVTQSGGSQDARRVSPDIPNEQSD